MISTLIKKVVIISGVAWLLVLGRVKAPNITDVLLISILSNTLYEKLEECKNEK